jgi:hypothetical protein
VLWSHEHAKGAGSARSSLDQAALFERADHAMNGRGRHLEEALHVSLRRGTRWMRVYEWMKARYCP